MHIDEVSLEGFTEHEKTRLQLPKRGVVLIQGPNGGGKSSIIEGVSMAFWGTTLRGSTPWIEDKAGRAAAKSDIADAERRASKGGRKSLSWSPHGATNPVEYENTEKAQEALEQLIGPFSIWRRAAVFSSHDAAHFSSATDAERKRLIEEILQLDRFDPALEAERKDASALRKRAETLSSKATAAKSRLETLRAQTTSGLQTRMPGIDDPEALAARAKRVVLYVKELEEDLESVRDRLSQLQQRRGENTGKLHSRTAQHKALKGRSICPTCEQVVPQSQMEKIEADITQLLAEVAAEEKATVAEESDERRARAQLMAELEVKRTEHRQLVSDHSSAVWHKKSQEVAAQASLKTEQEIKNAEVDMQAAQNEVATVQRELAVLEAVDDVLGLRGARAAVLGRALVGLERSGNVWLRRLDGGHLRLSVKPFVAKKSGGISDVIDLKVQKNGGPERAYDSFSGGERRRLDLAMLFALGDIAQNAPNGRPVGTRFFDEVFDALDTAGVDAAIEQIKAQAEDRCVVVISHNTALQDRIPAAVRLRVDGGKVHHL